MNIYIYTYYFFDFSFFFEDFKINTHHVTLRQSVEEIRLDKTSKVLGVIMKKSISPHIFMRPPVYNRLFIMNR
jgi:hypothetical protein